VKVSYDLGYATHTKSLLAEGHTTVEDIVGQIHEQLRLAGAPQDYAIEERNHMTQDVRFLKRHENPLTNQMRYGHQEAFVELWLVQSRDHSSGRGTSGGTTKSKRSSNTMNGSDESLEEVGRTVSPKEEVSDHGIAQLEGVLEEALQDLPSLVHEIQERLRVLSDSVANENGKPKPGLPPRRMLWDQLKPQAAQLVREIRRLVDNCEFLASRHCPSAVCQRIVTLLVELITDHSRELVSVTKEMCALRGAATTQFDSSVASFANQISYISNLIGKSHSAIRAAAISGHLLEVTAIDNLSEKQRKTSDGISFTGSSIVSAVLVFAEASAFLGLIRAGYDDKRDYFAKLAANVLRTANWAMNTVRETTEYSLLHLHPLRSRVHDMEQKLKETMDSLVIAVRKASDYSSSPDSVPEMLLAAHKVIMSTLDYLVVAQCASLLHQVFIPQDDILQMPWVQGVLASRTSQGSQSGSESRVSLTSSKPPSIHATSLSSVTTSDTASSTTSDTTSSRHSPSSKRKDSRKSRLIGAAPGENDVRLVENEGVAVSFSKLGMGASRLQLTGEMLGEEAPLMSNYDEVSEYLTSDHKSNDVLSSSSGKKKKKPKKNRARPKIETEGISSEFGDDLKTETGTRHSFVDSQSASEDSEGGGMDAIQRIRKTYFISRAIAKVAEALLLTVTRKITMLEALLKEGKKERCKQEVELVVAAAKQIAGELSVMDVDVVVGRSIAGTVDRYKSQVDAAIRDVSFAAIITFSPTSPAGTAQKLIATLKVVQDLFSKMVGEALKVVSEHKKAYDKAEELEKEYFGLMTGQRKSHSRLSMEFDPSGQVKKSLSSSKMIAFDSEAEKVMFEERPSEGFLPGASWTTRTAPLVIGGTLKQLIDRLTYPRSVDIEFSEVFLSTFHAFVSPVELMDALSKRYRVRQPDSMTPWEEESFETEIAIPTRLRVVSVIRNWLLVSYDDFRSKDVQQKLVALCEAVESSLPTCSKHLFALMKDNFEEGPVHIRQKARQNPPPTITPQNMGADFRIEDVNTLEIARQLALICSHKFRDIRCHDLLPRQQQTDTAKYINELQGFSNKVAHWVSETISSQDTPDEQVSTLGYFIQAAKNCHELKNFEGLFAIMKGLKENCKDSSPSWLIVSERISSLYYDLCEAVSSDGGYTRYRQELRVVNQSPCVPSLNVIIEDIRQIERDHPTLLPGMQGVVNFQKMRLFAHIFSSVTKHQISPYALSPLEPVQAFFSTLPDLPGS
jgi:hypothetical protein